MAWAQRATTPLTVRPLAAEMEVPLPDLADDPLLLSDGGCEPLLRRLYAAADCPLRPAPRVRDMDTLLTLVREHLGITIVPELALPHGHGLVCVPLRPAVRRRLHLVPANPADVPPPVAALLGLADEAGPARWDLSSRRRWPLAQAAR